MTKIFINNLKVRSPNTRDYNILFRIDHTVSQLFFKRIVMGHSMLIIVIICIERVISDINEYLIRYFY